jgi:hypothetical protein
MLGPAIKITSTMFLVMSVNGAVKSVSEVMNCHVPIFCRVWISFLGKDDQSEKLNIPGVYHIPSCRDFFFSQGTDMVLVVLR